MSTPANALYLALSEMRRHWKNFPVTYMLIFLEVAMNDIENKDKGILEVGERLNVPPSTVSRAISELSPRSIPAGSTSVIDLITTKPDPFDHRKRIPILTKNGRRVYFTLMRIMETVNSAPPAPETAA